MAGTMRVLATQAIVFFALLPSAAMAATIDVSSTLDQFDSGAACSLREAVEAANTNTKVSGCEKGQAGSQDVIRLRAKTYALTIPGAGLNENDGGDLDAVDGGPLVIRGKGRDFTQIGTELDDRLLELAPGARVTVEDAELTGGDTSSLLASVGGCAYASPGSVLKAKGAGFLMCSAGLGGGVGATGDARLRFVRSVINQSVAERGGGLGLLDSASASLKRSSVILSSATRDDAGVAAGAGIYASGESLTLADTTFSGNTVTNDGSGTALGGDVYSDGELRVRRSLFQFASVRAASGGTDEDGGAVYVVEGFGSEDATREVINSTFVGSEAGASDGQGGAIFVDATALTVAHATFYDNTAAQGDHLGARGDAHLRVRNSILPGELASDACEDGAAGSVQSAGYNLFNLQDADCAPVDTDEVVGDVGLATTTPVNNGGPTETIALTPSSEAVDLVPKPRCKVADGEDQRGFGRPAGDRCDAGAFERRAKP
jgi:hypothetical protein